MLSLTPCPLLGEGRGRRTFLDPLPHHVMGEGGGRPFLTVFPWWRDPLLPLPSREGKEKLILFSPLPRGDEAASLSFSALL